MHIIYDPQFDEYGVLMNENFKKVLKKTHEDFAKVAPTLGDEFIFSTGGKKIAPLDMDAFPKEMLNSDIPVVKFMMKTKRKLILQCIHHKLLENDIKRLKRLII